MVYKIIVFSTLEKLSMTLQSLENRLQLQNENIDEVRENIESTKSKNFELSLSVTSQNSDTRKALNSVQSRIESLASVQESLIGGIEKIEIKASNDRKEQKLFINQTVSGSESRLKNLIGELETDFNGQMTALEENLDFSLNVSILAEQVEMIQGSQEKLEGDFVQFQFDVEDEISSVVSGRGLITKNIEYNFFFYRLFENIESKTENFKICELSERAQRHDSWNKRNVGKWF